MTTVFNPFHLNNSNNNNNSNNSSSNNDDSFRNILLDIYNSDDNATVLDVIDKVINTYNNEENKNSTTLNCSFTCFKTVNPEDDFIVKNIYEKKLYYDQVDKKMFESENITLGSFNENINEKIKNSLQEIKFKDIFLNKTAVFTIKTNKNDMIRVHHNQESKLLRRYSSKFNYDLIQAFNLNLYPCEISFYDLTNDNILSHVDICDKLKNISEIYIKRNKKICTGENKTCSSGHVFIKDILDTILMIPINYDSSVSQLKKDIYDASNVLPENQLLTYLGRELDDFCNLRDYKIFDRRTILLKSQIDINSEQYDKYFRGMIFLKSLCGKTITFPVEFNQTVQEFKQKVEKEIYIKVEEQRILYAGMQLEDEKQLRDYNIQKHSILHLVLRLRGGMHHEISSRTNDKGIEVYDFYLQCKNPSTNEIIKLEISKDIKKYKDLMNLVDEIKKIN